MSLSVIRVSLFLVALFSSRIAAVHRHAQKSNFTRYLSLLCPSLPLLLTNLVPRVRSESWEAKGKFPPSIKPILAEVAVTAIRLDEYDEHFFNLMPVLFPYNKFTMTVRFYILLLYPSIHPR